MTDNIYVHLVPGLPVPEMVAPCTDGWSIQIRAGMTREQTLKSYFHALRHIFGGDFEETDVQAIEGRRH